MIVYFLIIYSLYYFYCLVINIYNFFKINRLLFKINQYLNEEEETFYTKSFGRTEIMIQKDFNLEKLSNIIDLQPNIYSVTQNIYNSISHSYSAEKNIDNLISIYRDLLDELANAKFKLKNNLNPFIILRKLLNLPFAIIQNLGFPNIEKFKSIINLIGWVITTILVPLYSEEIKNFIFTLFDFK